MKKRLYRNRDQGVFLGVCEGIGDYLNIDPVIIRIIWLLTFISYGIGIAIYFIAAILIPNKSL